MANIIWPTDTNKIDPILDGNQVAAQDSSINELGYMVASELQAYVLGKQIGGLVLPRFVWSSTTAISVGGGAYHHAGTVDQWVGWSSALAFTFGPAGSNALSSALGTSQWMYLYIDDSAVVTAASSILTDSELVGLTTVPTYSEAKGGFYNGLDRAVYMVYINSAGEVEGFWQIGENIFAIARKAEEVSVTPSNVWTTYTCSSCPTIVDAVIMHFVLSWVSNSSPAELLFRSKTLGGSGHGVAPVASTSAFAATPQVLIPLDSSQQYEIQWNIAVTNTTNINYSAFRLPRGMR